MWNPLAKLGRSSGNPAPTLLESGFARHCHQEQKMLMTSASFVQRVSPLKFLKWREKKPFKTRLYAAKVAPLRNRVAQQNTSS